jgi:hypothetical protein
MTTNAAGPHQAPDDPRQYRLKLFPVCLAIVVFYFFAVLLNANGIKRNIELMQYGRARDVCLSLFSPVAGFSNRLGLTKFRAMLETSIGDRIRNAKIKP